MTLYSDCACCDGVFELQHLRLYDGQPRCCGCIELEGEDWQDHPPVTVDDLGPQEGEALSAISKTDGVFFICPDCNYRTTLPVWVSFYGDRLVVSSGPRPRVAGRARPNYLEPVCPRCYDKAPPPTKPQALGGDLPEMKVEGEP